ncbi:hypothetical protein B9G69_007705 [Bdellovibrio sp. SKB1291214]|uniref:hypothetical protein n=1 Tax=Bdellovibrio sp. SKB1291214 TaxID=1732569 RepID=UPI001131165F|nr:hypothetical protein [Bdellovibrio sp. SKB1291214]UYL10463.1 hypothetical protein B9G69_007705 [Bdellovibrio sp. SKB1291214]
MKNIIFGLYFVFSLVGCAGTYQMKASDSLSSYNAKTVHVINQGGNSKDMDDHVARALIARGFKVSDGLPTQTVPKTDLLVKYTDSWFWDVTMYLKAVEVTFYDRNGNILASGEYNNHPFFHGYPEESEVVQKIIDGIVEQMGKAKLQKQAAAKP